MCRVGVRSGFGFLFEGGDPAVDGHFVADAAGELEWGFETGRCLGGWVGVASGVGDAGEAVIAEGGFGAGVVAEERARFVAAFDDVVFEAEGGEVGGFVEAEETVFAVFCGGAGDDVIVSDGEVGVGFVHPDDAAAWV